MVIHDEIQIIQKISELKRLKKQKNAIILAHNYQIPQVQDIADVVGDSLELARISRDVKEDVIVLCGVYFMAESAKILAPQKTVLLPRLDAGCPLANMITPENVQRLRLEHPDATVVCYVNSSAAVKAVSDVCCTSANAVQVVKNIENDKIVFIPDQNLGYYVSTKTDKEIILWPGFCVTHHKVTKDDVMRVKSEHPESIIMVHPECNKEVLSIADVITSTSGMISYANDHKDKTFVIGTEEGLLHRLTKDNPGSKFYLASSRLICPNMKKTTLDDVLHVIETGEHAIEVAEDIRIKALKTLDVMLEHL